MGQIRQGLELEAMIEEHVAFRTEPAPLKNKAPVGLSQITATPF